MDTIRIAHKIVEISKDKLRHKTAEVYPLRKQLFIDRVIQKAEQKTLSEDSYHIMCELERFIEEMTTLMKTRRSDEENQENRNNTREEETENVMTVKSTKRKRQYTAVSRRKRHRENVRL